MTSTLFSLHLIVHIEHANNIRDMIISMFSIQRHCNLDNIQANKP